MKPKNTKVVSSLGDRLRQFAKTQHGSVAALTRTIGKGRNFLGSYIENRAKPGSEILAAVARAGCDINWLLTGEGPMIRTISPSAPSIVGHEANIAKERLEVASTQVISGAIESMTLTIFTSDGKRVVVVKMDN